MSPRSFRLLLVAGMLSMGALLARFGPETVLVGDAALLILARPSAATALPKAAARRLDALLLLAVAAFAAIVVVRLIAPPAR